MKRIYLDYQASTPVDERVVEKTIEIMGLCANPHSGHLDGYLAQSLVDESRDFISELFDIFEDEIVFTSGATESNNLAVLGTLERLKAYDSSRNKVVVSMLEHRSVLEPLQMESERLGLDLVYAPISREGFVELDFLAENIDEQTLFVSLCAVNAEIGTVQPIQPVGTMCAEMGAVFHVDATQAFYENIKPSEIGINLMSMSAHKMYGPMGVGMLYVDSCLPIKLKPLFYGGGQQDGVRPGTMPVHQVCGFAEALKLISENLHEKNALKSKRDLMLHLLRVQIPDIKVNGSLSLRHPGNLSVQFVGVDGRTLVNNVKNELSISTGSACSSGLIKPSAVLKAIGLSDQEANATVRMSVGRFTSDEDLIQAISVLKMQYDRLSKTAYSF